MITISKQQIVVKSGLIHVGAPDDVESYIQETERGGRDGNLSLATLLVVNRNNQF